MHLLLARMKFRFVLILLLPFVLSACIEGVDGNGNVVEREYPIVPFQTLSVSGHFSVYLTQGEATTLVFEADENLQEYLELKESNGMLSLSTREKIATAEALNLIISSPVFERIDISGAAEIVGETAIEGQSLVLTCSGASQVDLDVALEKLKVNISGAADIYLQGEAVESSYAISGAANFKSRELECARARLHMSGAGDAEIYASESLDLRISGAASCVYYGDATVSKEISGVGSVSKGTGS